MNNKLYQILAYGKFAFSSKNRHSVHSPFVYEMCEKVLRNDKKLALFSPIEQIREDLLKNNKIEDIDDLGAGSKSGDSNKKKIKTIAKYSLSSAHQCRLLYRIVKNYKPNIIVEIGTSLGISAAYMALGNPNSILYTIEGSEVIASYAQKTFNKLNMCNIQLLIGDFDSRLPLLLEDLNRIDMIFIDGNHTYKNTINYFEMALRRSHNDTIIIIDDIYWSESMNEAWIEIQNHERTKTTIDLFYFGIVLLRKEMSKEHFKLRY